MRVFVLAVCLFGCAADTADNANSVEAGDGYLDGAGDCGCNIYMDNTDFPAIQLDCDKDTEVYVDIPPIDLTIAVHAEGQVTDGPYTYYPDRGGIAVITIGPEYTDPRGAPFDEHYEDVYIESVVIPAQRACDPIHEGHCIDFPRSSMRGLRLHCEQVLEDL